MLAVRKIENVRASMLVSLKMDMELVEIHVLSMSHVPEMLSVKSMTNFLFVSWVAPVYLDTLEKEMYVVTRFYLLNQLDALPITNVHQPKLVETGIASILVPLTNLVLKSLHALSTTTELDASVHQDMKEMDFHHVQRLEKENVSMMSTVRIIEHVFNINVSTLAIY